MIGNPMRTGVPRYLAGILTAAFFALLPVAKVDACSCGPPDCRNAASYDAVFEATVESLVPPPQRPDGLWSSGDPLTVRLGNVRALRGDPPSQVITAQDTVSCGYDFVVGQRYLIFAMRSTDDGQLHVASCGLTRPLAGASSLVRYVKSLSAPSTGGRIWGRVVVPHARPSRTAPLGEPMALAEVSLSGPRTAVTRTTTSGEFELVDLPPGSYTIGVANPPERPELSFTPQDVLLENTYACGDLTFLARIDSLVEGTVVDQHGTPMSGVFIMLVPWPADGDRPGMHGGWGTNTDDQGRYQFRDVPAGRYTARIGLRAVRNGVTLTAPDGAPASSIIREVTLASGGRAVLEPIRLTTPR